jgi:hypothetical protein
MIKKKRIGYHLNVRQQKYKKNRLMGMSKLNAARSAGYSEAVARSHALALDERCGIADILERQGLTDAILVKKHAELLNAQKIVLVDGKPIAVEEGGVSLPEYYVQAKALELAYKLKNHLRDRNDPPAGNSQKVIVIINEGEQSGNNGSKGKVSRAVSIVNE